MLSRNDDDEENDGDGDDDVVDDRVVKGSVAIVPLLPLQFNYSLEFW